MLASFYTVVITTLHPRFLIQDSSVILKLSSYREWGMFLGCLFLSIEVSGEIRIHQHTVLVVAALYFNI